MQANRYENGGGNAQLPDRTRIRKRDLVLAAALLLAAGILFIIFRAQQSGDGVSVVIRVDGKQIGAYSLSDAGTYPVQTEYGTNLLEIADGRARIIEADCPGQDCIRQGAVSRKGETIVCLPHRMVAEVTGTEHTNTQEAETGEPSDDKSETVVDGGFDTVAK